MVYRCIRFFNMFGFLSMIPGSAAWQRARMRAVMRGYRALKATSRLGVIGEIKNLLTESRITACEGKFSPAVLGAAAASAELALRQYLLVQRGGVNLNRVLLMAAANPKRSIAYAMPKDWRQIVREYGFRVSEWGCKIYWAVYVFGMIGYAAVRVVRIFAEGLRLGCYRQADESCSAYFLDLSPANLPQSDADPLKHDIISWFSKWDGREKSISAVRHGVLGMPPVYVAGLFVAPQKGALPPLAGARELTSYARWGLFAILKSAVDALRGRWWHAVLLSHAAVAAQARHVPAETLARSYWFHNSGWIYRPLWTYEVERKGCDVVMYFYSTNCEPFKRASGYPPMYYGYRAMNWPRYLVWDDYQAELVRRATDDEVRLEVVGPIWFQGRLDDIKIGPGMSVAVFDVTPFRASKYCTMGLDTEYFTPSVAKAFLEDINFVVRQFCGTMVWKRKRNIGRTAHPYYRSVAERIGSDPGVSIVDADVSAIKVIQVCDITISAPFTSTAILARQLGKPTVYYDPTGKVMPDDRAAHGIPVLTGREALEGWIKDHLGMSI